MGTLPICWQKGPDLKQFQPLLLANGERPRFVQYLIEQPYGSEVALLTALPAMASSSAAVT